MTTLEEAIAAAWVAEHYDALLDGGCMPDLARVAAQACDVHRATTTEHLDYEEHEPVTIAGDDLVPCDQVTARAAAADLPGLGIVPVLILNFGQSTPGRAPHPVARVAVLLTPDAMRKVGKVVRDAANGAANAAERATLKQDPDGRRR